MRRCTPLMRDFAERLMAYETKGKKSPRAKLPLSFGLCAKLRAPLATLMGQAGFSALLSRALALAIAEVPRLRTVRVGADGALAGWDETENPAEAEQMVEGGIVLLAQLLDLLAAFIGENLTLRLLHQVWPELTLSELYFEKETKNEKAN